LIKKKKTRNKLVKIVEEDKSINFYINKINLVDAYSFVNKNIKIIIQKLNGIYYLK